MSPVSVRPQEGGHRAEESKGNSEGRREIVRDRERSRKSEDEQVASRRALFVEEVPSMRLASWRPRCLEEVASKRLPRGGHVAYGVVLTACIMQYTVCSTQHA